MLNHGLQMNDLQTEFPAYPKLKLQELQFFKRTIVYTLQCHSECNEESPLLQRDSSIVLR